MRAWLHRSFVAGLAAALLIGFVPLAEAACNIAQTIKTQGTSSPATSGAVTTTNGSTFVMCTGTQNTVSTIADSKTNTWTTTGSALSSGGLTGNCWYTTTTLGGASHTFTLTMASGSIDAAFYVLEITGASASPHDAAARATASDAATPFTVTSNTLAQANNCAIGFIFSNGSPATWTAGGGFTKLSDETNDGLYWTNAIGWLLTSSTTAVTPSWTVSGSGSTTGNIVVVFKEAAGGGSTAVPVFMHHYNMQRH